MITVREMLELAQAGTGRAPPGHPPAVQYRLPVPHVVHPAAETSLLHHSLPYSGYATWRTRNTESRQTRSHLAHKVRSLALLLGLLNPPPIGFYEGR